MTVSTNQINQPVARSCHGIDLVEALRRAGKGLTREKLISALEDMNSVNMGGFVVGFSPTNHSGSKFVDLTMIGRGGKSFVR